MNPENGQCENSCSGSIYTDTPQAICGPALSCPDCKTCDKGACLDCEDTYFLYNKKCFSTCPDKTYSSGTTCKGKLLIEEIVLLFFHCRLF